MKLSKRQVNHIKEMAGRFSDKTVAYLVGTSGCTVHRLRKSNFVYKSERDIYQPEQIVNKYKTKRVCELVKGDNFRMFGSFVECIGIKDGRLYVLYLTGKYGGRERYSLGANSRQIVEVK